MESDQDLAAVVEYMQSHWPSQVKPEWQVPIDAYPAILQRAVADLSANATQNRQFIRVAGISGSGKTTQILPAVDAYCEKNSLRPVLTAARKFVKYHPHYQAILDFYGAENLRKMTDEFSTIMLFLSLKALTAAHYDIVLDVTLLDPKMEAILLKFLSASDYNLLMLMVATSPAVTEHFLADRAWRHTKETENEFVRATTLALQFYAQNSPQTRIILWSVYQAPPAYDGPVENCLPVFQKLSQTTTLPAHDDDARRQAKIDYLTNIK